MPGDTQDRQNNGRAVLAALVKNPVQNLVLLVLAGALGLNLGGVIGPTRAAAPEAAVTMEEVRKVFVPRMEHDLVVKALAESQARIEVAVTTLGAKVDRLIERTARGTPP